MIHKHINIYIFVSLFQMMYGFNTKDRIKQVTFCH